MPDINRVNISIGDFHKQWIQHQRATNEDFNFSKWVREKIEEEANDAPTYL